MKCKICGVRKARRYCPGVVGDICSICCGSQREVTVDCPRDCPYLIEARTHERYVPLDKENVPYPEIRLGEKFLDEHKQFVTWVGITLEEAANKNPRAVDSDLREALESLAKSYRTLTHGLIYESRPLNPVAAGIYDKLQASIQEFKDEAGPIGKGLRDPVVLTTLVLFLRFALDYNNGRPKGRSFIDVIATQFRKDPDVIPESPRLIEL